MQLRRHVFRLFEHPGSVIRRSLGLFAFFIPGLVLNYGLIFLAARILDSSKFGVFYSALSIINVLTAPTVVFGLIFTRYFSTVLAARGEGAMRSAFRIRQRQALKWGGAVAAGVVATMLALGQLLGVESPVVVIMIVLASLAIYVAEFCRSALQGLQAFFLLGVFGLCWLVLRFLFTGAGIYWGDAVWTGLFGMTLAGAMIAYSGYVLIGDATRQPDFVREEGAGDLDFLKLGPFLGSYAIFALFAHADILYAFVWLDRVDNGVYAATSVIPKALLLLLIPVIQIVFPLLSGIGDNRQVSRVIATKGHAATIVLSVAAAAFFQATTSLTCDGVYSISYCRSDLMHSLIWSAVPLCVLRVQVLTHLAANRDRLPLLLVVPVACFALVAIRDAPGLSDLAALYVTVCWATMLGFGLISLVADRVARR